jgi:hypothetical protein
MLQQASPKLKSPSFSIIPTSPIVLVVTKTLIKSQSPGRSVQIKANTS